MRNSRITNLSSQAIAQNGTTHHQNTISSSAELVVNYTLSPSSTHVFVQFNGADARVTFDGTTPTASLGFLFVDGSSAYWEPHLAAAAKAIRAASTDVVVEMQELNSL
jgi:hypothetical protein